MNRIYSTLLAAIFIFGLLFSNYAIANSAERTIVNSVKDIQRYEQQFVGKTSVNKNSVKRTLKLLRLTRQRLDGVVDKSRTDWQQADDRLKALHRQLEGLLQDNAQASVPSVVQSEKKKISSTQPVSSSAGKQMIGQHQIRVKKIKREVDNQIDEINRTIGTNYLQRWDVRKYLKTLKRAQQAIQKYQQYASNPLVIATHQSITNLDQLIITRGEQAARDQAALRQENQALATANDAYRKLQIPSAPISSSLQIGQTRQWLTDLQQYQREAVGLYQPVQEVQRKQNISVIYSQINSLLQQYSLGLGARLKIMHETLDDKAGLSGSDLSLQPEEIQSLLYPGNASNTRLRLTSHQLQASEAIEFIKIMKTGNLEQWRLMLSRVEAAQKRFESNLDQAFQHARMPVAVSNDAELLVAARNSLTTTIQPGYDKIGEIKKLVITSAKVHHANDVSNATYDNIEVTSSNKITLTGTEITTHFEWDEFKVTSAEKINGKYFIYSNTLSYYTQGGYKTELNRWLVTERNLEYEIPVANLDL